MKYVRKKRRMDLSLSMGNQLIAPVVVFLLFCIRCISTSDDSVDILPNETDSKVSIKTNQTYTNYMYIYIKGCLRKNLTDQILFSLYLGPRCSDLQSFGVYPP
jgi:hypothetical protein